MEPSSYTQLDAEMDAYIRVRDNLDNLTPMQKMSQTDWTEYKHVACVILQRTEDLKVTTDQWRQFALTNLISSMKDEQKLILNMLSKQ